MKPTLVYCYDALCGWCYGFSPVMQTIKTEFEHEFNFEILSGGMMLGKRAGPIGIVAPFVKTAYKTVEQHTGIRFGDAYLNDLLGPAEMMMNSWKPSLALTAFKSMQAGDPFAFGSALQRTIYFDGNGPDLDETYRKIAPAFNLEPDAFLVFMNSASVQEQTRLEFARVGRYGVSGFPALLFDFGGDHALFMSGYRSESVLRDALNRVLTQL